MATSIWGPRETAISPTDLMEGIESLRNLPDDHNPGLAASRYPFVICPKCHMGYNVDGHIDRCDYSRPGGFECLICYPETHTPENAERRYQETIVEIQRRDA